MSGWSLRQRHWLAAMDFVPLAFRPPRTQAAGERLGALALPARLRLRLEHWAGATWPDWPAPAGNPAEAGFKRALWRRIRDGRRGA